MCHVGFMADGQQYVIPTAYARIDETLYIHGSAVSRMLKSLAVLPDRLCCEHSLVKGPCALCIQNAFTMLA